jgi:hypothetical protein
MQALAQLAAHQRRVRVVGLLPPEPHLDVSSAESLELGLLGLRLLHTHFHGFYAQHVGEQIVTPSLLFRATAAFYALANEVCPLQMPLFLNMTRTPEQWITNGEWGDHGALAALDEFGFYLRAPYPLLYGIGINALLDGHRDVGNVRLLTLVLWHLFHHTRWGLGIDLADVMDDGRIEPWAVELVLSLQPLPGATDVEDLIMHLELPDYLHPNTEIPTCEIIAYAFARTSVDLANVDDYDIDTVYGGMILHDWEDLEELGACAADAQGISEAYYDLAERMHRHHETAFKQVAELLHETNRACKRRRRRERQSPTPLVDVLTDDVPAIDQEAIAEL